ncbi:MAG: hypothetical protein Q4A71_00720 [Actinomycetaceae bacterium]|nr:hypothetical protein [Actinomycetaceae bacterium]
MSVNQQSFSSSSFGVSKSSVPHAAPFAQVSCDGADTYWVETFSTKSARNALLRRGGGQIREILPLLPGGALPDVRTQIRGGRAYAVCEGVVVFSNSANGCLYRFDVNHPEGGALRLTPEVAYHFADMVIDLVRGVVFAVRAGGDGGSEIVAVPLDGAAARENSNIQVLFSEDAHATSLALSVAGHFLAFVCASTNTNTPSRSKLCVAELGFMGDFVKVHNLVDAENVAVFQPRWTLEDDLIHIDNSSGWANLYRTEGFNSSSWQSHLRTRALHPTPKNFSLPTMAPSTTSFGNLDITHLVATWWDNEKANLGSIRLDNGQLETWETGWRPLGNVDSQGGRTVAVVEDTDGRGALIEIKRGTVRVLRQEIGTTPANMTNNTDEFERKETSDK